MDFKLTSMTINWLTNIGATMLLCACLLNCGCQSEPADDASNDSTRSQSVASGKTSAGKNPASPPEAIKPKPPVSDVNDPQFHPAIKAAAEQYLQFAMVNTTGSDASVSTDSDTESFILEDPAAKMSQAEANSDSGHGHGQKLYFLFAKDIGHYVNPDGTASPVGQALVMESWTAVPGNPDARNLRSHASGNRVNPRVTVNGETVKLGQRRDLFVMLKQDSKADATDEGWVYGMVDPQSHVVKSAGAVASCIVCHEEKQDRLFRDGIIDWNAQAQKLMEPESVPTEESGTTDSEADE